jgi:hypothetical protein
MLKTNHLHHYNTRSSEHKKNFSKSSKPTTATSHNTELWIDTTRCHRLNVPHTINEQLPESSKRQIL